jgi:hypothetical protein
LWQKKRSGFAQALFLLFFDKKQAGRIGAVAGIFIGEALTGKDMAQVAAAVGANDFHPVAIGVGNFLYIAFYGIVETGPTGA